VEARKKQILMCFQVVFIRSIVSLAAFAALGSLHAASFQTRYNFEGPWGVRALAQGNDNAFYATTGQGGDYGYGSVIRISATGKISLLVSFANTNGANPQAGLALGDEGVFYGTTAAGGAYGKGTVFHVTTNGVLTLLVSFSGKNGPCFGERPGSLARGADGAFYGTTYLGGFADAGTIFRITSGGTFATVLGFKGGTNGLFPTGGVTFGNDTTLYGVCASGGDYGYGTVYRLTPDGTLTTLYSFMNHDDGSQPSAGLLQASDGALYGTAYFGGLSGNGDGTVFRITTNGVLTVLATFLGGDDGANPGSRLVQGRDGALYGTTTLAGINAYGVVSQGTLFRLTMEGAFTTLVPFVGTNGTSPAADLMLGNDGAIFGTTFGGGAGNAGTIFRVGTNGTFSTFVSLIITNGQAPQSALLQAKDGVWYGTTTSGGTGGAGTVFRLGTNGSLTTLVAFNGTNGASPHAALTLGSDGSVYGVTAYGGASNCGTVFKLTTEGNFITLASFLMTNGARPFGTLLQDSDNSLYGTTVLGGQYSKGTVFRIATNGSLAVVASFDGTNGSNPQAGLLKGNDGAFYGTTVIGGTNNNSGTVFRVTADGTLRAIFTFNPSRWQGMYPRGPLLLGPDGAFYGTVMHTYTGNGGCGAVFRVTSNGTFTNLAWFDDYYPTGGRYPIGELVQGTDQALYGVTTGGGSANSSGLGTIFRVTTNGTLTTVFSFNAGEGSSPLAGLVRGDDGTLWGTTSTGGTFGGGTFFRLELLAGMKSLTQAGSGWRVGFTGIPDVPYRVLYANDLRGPWSTIAIVVPDPDFQAEYLDLTPPATRAFYRVATP